MNPGEPTPKRSPIFYEILAYLADHPQAQDTVEGVEKWWVQGSTTTSREVKAALEDLVAEKLMIRTSRTGHVFYRANRQKRREIRQLMEKSGRQ
ncbi:MAG: hypothetical protein AB7G75_04675 [Candidatus Binatia bacterium]